MRAATVILAAFLATLFGCSDDGAGNENTNNNNDNPNLCGNGIREGSEECDDGAANSDSVADACRTSCALASCGDGVVDTSEQCDDGPANSDVVPDACREGCTPPRCGDGVVDIDRGELCDDGNEDPGDGCSPECRPEYCGNGTIDPDEECDDGNFSAGDGCGPTCLVEACGNGFVDAANGESCDDGNFVSHDGCDSRCGVEVPEWRRIEELAPRQYFGMAYDEGRDVVVAFGGADADLYRMGDTWEFDGQAWRQIFPVHTPAARSYHAMVYDATRGVIVLFGGRGDLCTRECNDTWEFDGVDWTEVTTANQPRARFMHGMAYDAARGEVVLFGGRGFDIGFTPRLGDTWVYDGVDWEQRNPTTSPPARRQTSMAYDAARQRVVLFGGICNIGTPECTSETWLWDGADWCSRLPGSAAIR